MAAEGAGAGDTGGRVTPMIGISMQPGVKLTSGSVHFGKYFDPQTKKTTRHLLVNGTKDDFVATGSDRFTGCFSDGTKRLYLGVNTDAAGNFTGMNCYLTKWNSSSRPTQDADGNWESTYPQRIMNSEADLHYTSQQELQDLMDSQKPVLLHLMRIDVASLDHLMRSGLGVGATPEADDALQAAVAATVPTGTAMLLDAGAGHSSMLTPVTTTAATCNSYFCHFLTYFLPLKYTQSTYFRGRSLLRPMGGCFNFLVGS